MGQPTQLMRADVNPGGGFDFVPVGSPDPGGYNALGAHLPTRTLYAVGAASQSLVSIDSAGALHDELFLGETSSVAAFAEGALQDRFYYIPRNTQQLSWVNVLTHERGTTAMDASYAPVDFVFSHDAFWGVTIENDAAILVRVGLDGLVSSETMPDVVASAFPSSGFGGAWKYGNGNLGFSNNGGGILQIRILDSVAMSTETVGYASSPASSSVDAATLPYAPTDLGVQLVAERSGPGQPLSLRATVRNHGASPSSGYVLDLAPVGADTRSVVPGEGCMDLRFGSNCAGGPLLPGEERSHTFVVTYQPGDPDISWSWRAAVLGYEADPEPANDQSTIADSVGGDLGIRIRLQDSNGNAAADPGETYDAFGVLRNDSTVTVYSIVVNASGLLKDSQRLERPMQPGEQRTVRFSGVMPAATPGGPTNVVMEFRGEADGVPLLLGEDSLKLVGAIGTGGGSGGNGQSGGSGGTGGQSSDGSHGSGAGWGSGSARASDGGTGGSGLSSTGDITVPWAAAAATTFVGAGLLVLLFRRRRMNIG